MPTLSDIERISRGRYIHTIVCSNILICKARKAHVPPSQNGLFYTGQLLNVSRWKAVWSTHSLFRFKLYLVISPTGNHKHHAVLSENWSPLESLVNHQYPQWNWPCLGLIVHFQTCPNISNEMVIWVDTSSSYNSIPFYHPSDTILGGWDNHWTHFGHSTPMKSLLTMITSYYLPMLVC